MFRLLRGKNRAEIRIGGNYNAILLKSPCHDIGVFCRLHSIGPNVDGVISCRQEKVCQARW